LYDPYLQRWVNRDPLQEVGGVNMYRFVGNNPLSQTDSLGLATREQLEELKKEIELIQRMRDLANQMIENLQNCKPQCLGVSSVVAHYCSCYRDYGKSCEDFAECICVQLSDDKACKKRAVKACKIAKEVLDAHERTKGELKQL
ncbi:MAG: hypothetical protein M5U12_17490, partial [Verrucomicrobia bacterium]|nr:hypothetical protein [Verrucomicrobiota bacterium]